MRALGSRSRPSVFFSRGHIPKPHTSTPPSKTKKPKQTDALIQDALRRFTRAEPTAGRTLLVIAHRIDTILDTDQLLVLSAGRLVESGPPGELAARAGGTFAGMVAAARLAAAGAGDGKA